MRSDRWKGVERDAAWWLNLIFQPLGVTPIERIPILGRTGPDLTINEIGLVIDVKHRKRNPAFPIPGTVLCSGCILVVELKHLVTLSEEEPRESAISINKEAHRWWEHMNQWTVDNAPDGITALILHKPHTHVAQSTVLMHRKDWSILHERISNPKSRTEYRAYGAGPAAQREPGEEGSRKPQGDLRRPEGLLSS